MRDSLILGVPSKGRLMEDTLSLFQAAGFPIEKTGDERGYRGAIAGHASVTVEFLSAGEIARHLLSGRLHLGVTGEDLLREQNTGTGSRIGPLYPLGFGQADVVVAVPDCWLDVQSMADLDAAGALFAAAQNRKMRIATKYPQLTRQFFKAHGVVNYRTVESLGATEGAPAGGTAEAIVDITTTGTTLKANGLRVLDDGLVLKSEANLAVSSLCMNHATAIEICEKVALTPGNP